MQKTLEPRTRVGKFTVLGFIIAELVLSFVIQYTSGHVCAAFSYTAVCLALLMGVLTVTPILGRVGSLPVLVGLGFTVLADLCLVVISPPERLFGMIFFLGTQISYAVCLYLREAGRVRIIHLALRASLTALAVIITLLVLGGGADALSVISVVYYANLLLNVALAFLDAGRHLCFALGLTCFALCDLFVGLDLIHLYLPVAEGSFIWQLTHTGVNTAWLFYVPSLTLIPIDPALGVLRDLLK